MGLVNVFSTHGHNGLTYVMVSCELTRPLLYVGLNPGLPFPCPATLQIGYKPQLNLKTVISRYLEFVHVFSTHGHMGLAYKMASCDLTSPYTTLFRHDVSFHPATPTKRMSMYTLRWWVPGVFSTNMATCDMTSCELTRSYTALCRFEPIFALQA